MGSSLPLVVDQEECSRQEVVFTVTVEPKSGSPTSVDIALLDFTALNFWWQPPGAGQSKRAGRNLQEPLQGKQGGNYNYSSKQLRKPRF